MFNDSYIKVILDIAETDPRCNLSFVKSDIHNARKELASLQDALAKVLGEIRTRTSAIKLLANIGDKKAVFEECDRIALFCEAAQQNELTEFQELVEGARQFAAIVRAYYEALKEGGFSHEDAMALTTQYQKDMTE